ncbi:hypothetical protein [Parasutterella excrementihominis]|uniref:hypothetical protein n=1 Tax=Parasutterella excrementihominis TaxID=487175 RepID=UPI002666AE1E|nr:hypothetical protein [Parasutterella excrementihominis]
MDFPNELIGYFDGFIPEKTIANKCWLKITIPCVDKFCNTELLLLHTVVKSFAYVAKYRPSSPAVVNLQVCK